MEQIQSKTIDWLRFPLILMVIFVHSHPMDNANFVGMQTLSEGSIGQVIYTFCMSTGNIFCNVSVPAFFFISGFLFFYHCKSWSWKIYKQKMSKRLYTLIIPYLLWNLLAVLNVFILPAIGRTDYLSKVMNPHAIPFIGFLWNSTTMCVGMKNWLGLNIQLYYPSDIPLWYVRDLIMMCILSPVIYWLIRRIRIFAVGVFGILFFIGALSNVPGFGSMALFFFTLGAYFSINDISITDWSQIHGKWWVIGAGLFLLFSTITDGSDWTQILQPFFFTSGIFALFYVSSVLIKRREIKTYALLSKATFFVYAVHILSIGSGSIMRLCRQLCLSIFNLNTPIGAAFNYLFLTFLTAAACVFLYWILERTVPRVLSAFTGGR